MKRYLIPPIYFRPLRTNSTSQTMHTPFDVRIVVCLLIGLVPRAYGGSEDTQVASPDGKLVIALALTDAGEPFYTVDYKGERLLEQSRLGIAFKEQPDFERGLSIAGSATESHDSTWSPVTGEKSEIRDRYNELTVELTDKGAKPRRLQIKLRAYNEGVAFCYTLPEQDALKDFVIAREYTGFAFTADHHSWSDDAVEGWYQHSPLSTATAGGRLSLSPFVVETAGGPLVALGEARMVDYARMRFRSDEGTPHSLRVSLDGPVSGTTPFATPWRFVMIGETPGALIENNDLVPNLNDPCALKDTSWITPGKAIRSKLDTDSVKGCVDLAAKLDLQYVLLDAGWYGPEGSSRSDATTVTLDPKRKTGDLNLDLPASIKYASDHGVGVILYVNRRALERQLDELLPLYQEWGVAGIKFGFVNVGSQEWTIWLHDAVRKCAEHELIVDIHDFYRPTGWSRTYPNLLTQEGVRGNEQMPTPEHNVTLPFLRFLCGPADYTVCYYSSRIKTTRAHQLAASIVYFSPLQLLFWYDNPSQYQGEPELDLFKQLHTTWDETHVINGEIGKYITTARRKGDHWFIGSMNAEERRQLEIPLDFLNEGVVYTAAIHSDASPEGKAPKEVQNLTQTVTSASTLTADMAANGGQAVWIRPSSAKVTHSPDS